MDISVFIGLVIAAVMLSQTIGLEMIYSLFYQPNSLFFVLGGIAAATCIHFPLKELKKTAARLKVALSIKKYDPKQDIEFFVYLAKKVKANGKSSILEDIKIKKDHFQKTALQLYVDNLEVDKLEKVLQENIDTILKRHHQGVVFFEMLGKYAPVFGLIGTVVGLIKLLAQLDDPATLGPNMSLALMTTFYGVLIANLIFGPLAGRLKTFSFQEMLQKEMLLVGIIALAQGESAFIVREKMMLFLSQKDRVFRPSKETENEKK